MLFVQVLRALTRPDLTDKLTASARKNLLDEYLTSADLISGAAAYYWIQVPKQVGKKTQ
ncbi:MAG TPA: hypothetical protein HA224_04135 [Nanoarchaeota archaeon]|nr:hypothetical protein [Nanoarchaeota archaeon]